ncbi:MAG: hypothetical protein AB7D39_05290 [Pseudodesulfovibrio sp.]|uniref:hypothetical protein n=1 Tax=Pseudodesulfovibrio sp. TaxID=2035812 RepID=UPI003D0B9720
MNMRTSSLVIAAVLLCGILYVAPALAAQPDADNDGVPDASEPLLQTDPMNRDTDGDGLDDLKDNKPVFAENPIDLGGAEPPFAIKELLVENNYDYDARKDATDHLELEVANNSSQPLNGFSIYYTITDPEGGKSEAYFKKLDGFTLPANSTARIHIDTSGLPGHYRSNPNSIYETSPAAKQFQVELKAEGYRPVSGSIKKDAGGAETAD